MFLPYTPGSELMKKIRETDREFRRGTKIKRVKFVERAGSSLTDLLVSGNPWGDQKCGRNYASYVKVRRETCHNA